MLTGNKSILKSILFAHIYFLPQQCYTIFGESAGNHKYCNFNTVPFFKLIFVNLGQFKYDMDL